MRPFSTHQRPVSRKSAPLWCHLLAIACLLSLVVAGAIAGASTAVAGAGSSRWVPPVVGPLRVIAAFDPPAQRWMAGHRGVDLAASPGEPVFAAGAGVISFAGTVAGRGVVTVTHESGRTTYEPVRASVRLDQTVRPGDRIGVIDAGGHCSQRCLHWGLIRADVYLDPLSLLALRPPVLKSLRGQTTGRALSGAPAPRSAQIRRVAQTQSASRLASTSVVGSAPTQVGSLDWRLALAASSASALAGVAVWRRRRRHNLASSPAGRTTSR